MNIQYITVWCNTAMHKSTYDHCVLPTYINLYSAYPQWSYVLCSVRFHYNNVY